MDRSNGFWVLQRIYVAAGTYRLVVTDNSGCKGWFRSNLTQNNEIKLEVTTTEIACYDYANASLRLQI
jgi:hypothetical protein